MRSQSSGSPASRARRSASSSVAPSSTRKPSSPSRTTSGTPPTRVATTGRPAARASIALTGVPSFDELDPEADDDEALGGRDLQRHEVVAHLRADCDQGRRPAGEPAFEEAEEQRTHRPEVAAQDVPVERVHDDRRLAPAGEERRDT